MRIPALALALTLASAGILTDAPPPAQAAAPTPSVEGWSLSTSNPFSADYHPTFVGNGYLAARVPAAGQGYSARDVATQFQIAGYYASGLPNQARASGPAWTGLSVSDGTSTFDDAFSAPCRSPHPCQMEDAELTGGPSPTTDHSGYHGSAFVQGWNAPTARGTLTVGGVTPGQSYDLVLRYAAGNPGDGSTAPRALTVTTDGAASAVELAPSPGNDWDTWMTVRLQVVPAADHVFVEIGCAAGQDCRVNLDEIALVPSGAAVSEDTSTPTMADRGLSNYHQTLDMKTGAIVTSATWTSASGHVSDIEYTVVADRADDQRAIVRAVVTPHWDGQLSVTDVLDTRPATFAKSFDTHRDSAAGTIGLDTALVGSGIVGSIASTLTGPGERASGDTSGLGAGSIAQQLTATVTSGSTYRFVKYVGLATNADGTDTAALAAAQSQTAATAGYESVRGASDAAWVRAWQGDIRVEGDAVLQEEIRASRFYLLASANAKRSSSLSPAGLSSDGYGGHVFWDTETWMWPSLVAQDPDIARAVLKYRSDRLPDAAANAAADGHAGIRFPWEEAPDLPKLPVGRAVWKPAPDFTTSAACWLNAGAAHHIVMTTAVGIDVFRDFAEMARTEFLVIDEDTTVRGFQRELRWNQAYYRLAQGL